MAKDLDDVFVDEDDLTPRQEKLLLWRDYLKLLQAGLVLDEDKGVEDEPWTENEVRASLWMEVAITELESDIMHIEGKQERFCRWDEPTDLRRFAINK